MITQSCVLSAFCCHCTIQYIPRMSRHHRFIRHASNVALLYFTAQSTRSPSHLSLSYKPIGFLVSGEGFTQIFLEPDELDGAASITPSGFNPQLCLVNCFGHWILWHLIPYAVRTCTAIDLAATWFLTRQSSITGKTWCGKTI